MLIEKMSVGILENLSSEIDEDAFRNVCSGLVSDILNSKQSLLELVESLEELLTSPDLKKHSKGLDVLAYIIECLPKDYLKIKEAEFITQFFCAQVKQHHSFISSSLKVLVILVKYSQLPKESLLEITTTLFNNVAWQTQTHSDRRMFYSILQYITFNRLEDYQSMSSDLLFSVISSVDGERDPRNLLLLFSFLPRLYRSIPLGPLAEEAFEVVSCYFPIDFHSAVSDPGAVTREDLVSALTPCLLAVPEFTTFCIPLIQEKLDSTLKSAKIDSYNLLVEGSKIWSSEFFLPHIEVLWLAIKKDTLPPRDTQIADAAIQALQALVKATPDSILPPLLDSIILSCEGYLTNVQLSLFEPSSRLLLSVMETTLPACQIVSAKLLPTFVSLLQVTQDSSQLIVLKKLTTLIQVCLHMNPEFNFAGAVCHELVRICTTDSLTELQQAAYSALTLVIRYLEADSRKTLYSSLLSQLILPLPRASRSSYLKCLQELAILHGEEVKMNILEPLSSYQGEGRQLDEIQNAFETICSVAIIDQFHPTLEQHFTDLVSRSPKHKSVVLNSLRSVLEEESVQKKESLIQFLFFQSCILNKLLEINADGDDLLNLAKIIQILISLQSASNQEKVVPSFVKRVLLHQNQTQKMVLLKAFLVPLWPEVTILSIEEIKLTVIPVALHSFENNLSRISALEILFSFINKSNDDKLLQLVSQSVETQPQDQITLVIAYITKALVLRSHPLMEHWIQKLVNLLDNEEIGHVAANGIQLLVDNSHIFSNNHCITKLLYRQRLFYIILPQLVQSAKKVQHLEALAYLLQAVPHSVYVQHIKQILPLLVESLDKECEGLLLTILDSLSNLLLTKDSFLEGHIDAFIPRFLKIAKSSPSMQVRIAALRCLSNSLKYSPMLLLPHKQQVILELVQCLDDKKRLVRKEAAYTRSKWFLLGAPTVD